MNVTEKDRKRYLEKYPLPNEHEDEHLKLRVDDNPNGGMDIYGWFKSAEFRQECKAAADREGISLDELFRRVLLRHLEEVEKQKKKQPAVPKLPRSPNPFQDDKGETAKGADNQFTHFAGEALAAGGKDFRRKVRKWQESKTTGQLQYRKERGSWLGGSMTAYFEPGNYTKCY